MEATAAQQAPRLVLERQTSQAIDVAHTREAPRVQIQLETSTQAAPSAVPLVQPVHKQAMAVIHPPNNAAVATQPPQPPQQPPQPPQPPPAPKPHLPVVNKPLRTMPVRRMAVPPPPPQRPAPRMPSPPPSDDGGESHASDDLDNALQDFANPVKKMQRASGAPPSEMSDGNDSFGGGSDDGSFDDSPPRQQEIITPSEGFKTLEEEKADLLFKLNRVRKQMPGLRQYTTHSDIRDMRAELARVKTEIELDRSIKFSRKILMACVGTLEFANNKFDPFDLQLDGWSEQVHDNLNDYDGVFEKLFFKYRNKVSMPPEMELLLLVGSSAFMFHLSNAMVKKAMPQMGDVLRDNPDMMANMMKMFAPPGTPQQQQQQQQQQQPPPPDLQPPAAQNTQAPPGQRREMKGPGVDLGVDLGGLMGGPLGGMMGGLGGGLGGLMSGGLMGGGGLGGGLGKNNPRRDNENVANPFPKKDIPVGFVPPVTLVVPDPGSLRAPYSTRRPDVVIEEEDERLSDVVSDDLDSVPDDLQSVRSASSAGSVKKRRGGNGSSKGVKDVVIGSQQPAAKRARTRGAPKNVLVI